MRFVRTIFVWFAPPAEAVSLIRWTRGNWTPTTVSGVTRGGDELPLLVGGAWQI